MRLAMPNVVVVADMLVSIKNVLVQQLYHQLRGLSVMKPVVVVTVCVA